MDNCGKRNKATSRGVGKDVLGTYYIGNQACAAEGMVKKNEEVLGVSGVRSATEEVRTISGTNSWLQMLCSLFQYARKRMLGSTKLWK